MKEIVVAGHKFTENTYYKLIDGKVYRNAAAGLFKEDWHTTRRVGSYKIHAEYFGDCALPQTDYYLIDTANGVIYQSKGHSFSVLEEIVAALKEMKGDK